MIIAFGGIGGIVATLIFRQQDQKTGYKPGFWGSIACQLLFLILLAINTTVFTRRNKAAREGKRVNEEQPGFQYII